MFSTYNDYSMCYQDNWFSQNVWIAQNKINFIICKVLALKPDFQIFLLFDRGRGDEYPSGHLKKILSCFHNWVFILFKFWSQKSTICMLSLLSMIWILSRFFFIRGGAYPIALFSTNYIPKIPLLHPQCVTSSGSTYKYHSQNL